MSPLNDYTFEISGPFLSDLFFNSEHPEYQALFANGHTPTLEQMFEAIQQDALTFAKRLPRGYNLLPLADALAEDFMERL